MKFLSSLGYRQKKRTGRGVSLRVGLSSLMSARRGSSPRTITRLLIVGLFLTVVAVLALATIKQSMAFLLDNSRYAIGNIDIIPPSYLSTEEIAALSGVSKGQNLMRLGIRQVRKRILEHPNIKDAIVQRVLPNTLRIEVKEREPLAQISIGKNYLVDSQGAVLTWNEKFAERAWPLIEGMDMKSKVLDNKIQSEALMDVLQILQLFHGSVLLTRMEIGGVQLDGPGGYLLATSRDIALRLMPGMTPAEIQDKFKKLEAVLEDLRKKGVNAESIDLRFDDIVVTPRGSTARAAKASAVVKNKP